MSQIRTRPRINSQPQPRNLLLDATKGLAIILVVFGHEVETAVRFGHQYSESGWTYVSNLWYSWLAIHHFHMALFIFISGYVSYGKLNSKWLQRRTLQLLLPYFAWMVILYYCSRFWFTGLNGGFPTSGGLVHSLLLSTWTQTTSGLWFLPLLLMLCVIAYVTKGNPVVMLLVSGIAYAISQLPSPSVLGHAIPPTAWFSRIAWFMPFYVLGYLISQYREKLSKLSFVKWVALIAFPVVFILAGSLNWNIPRYSWPAYSVFAEGHLIFGFYGFIMALLGIGMTIAVVEIICKMARIQRILAYIGGITLGIYCASNIARNIGLGTGLGWVITAMLVALVSSIVLIRIFQRFRITDYLLLGGAQKLVPRESWIATAPT
jgi:fucose 4-O-acetylase-like acetyltransferase